VDPGCLCPNPTDVAHCRRGNGGQGLSRAGHGGRTGSAENVSLLPYIGGGEGKLIARRDAASDKGVTLTTCIALTGSVSLTSAARTNLERRDP
jgi:hypothetical protein